MPQILFLFRILKAGYNARLVLACLFLTPFASGAIALRLEAEDGDLTGVTASTQASGYSGTGYVNGFDQAGDKVHWQFQAEPGFYNLYIGYRTPSGEKGFAGQLNGVGLSGHFPARSTFSEFSLGRVHLTGTENTLEIGGGWNWYEIDYARLVPVDPPEPPLPVTTPLVNAKATARTVRLMDYLKEQYGKSTLSGQFQLNEAAIIESRAGVRPAILNGDLIDYSPSRIKYGTNPEGYTESMIEAAKTGHILSLTWHWNAPTHLLNTAENRWWHGFYTRATTFDLEWTLANPDSQEYQLLIRDMDKIADELAKLQDADVPVLWRPLHESEGGWFWWGAKGAQPFKDLWRLMYDRYTNHHQLNNLIWVLASEDPDWYPGDDVVDIIGVDAYPEDRADPLVGRWEALIERFNGKKLLSLSEFGGVPDIPGMQFLGVWWSFFASWTGDLGPGSMETTELQRIYTAPKVVNLGDLPESLTRTSWAGYPVIADGWTDTGDFLGWINIMEEPYVYSEALQGWLYLPAEWITPIGTWVYAFKF